jgi:DNA-directed RNA polymerase subunit RPC12/RpoP
MAIEVIHRGRRPEEKPMTGRCMNCGTVIRCLRSDTTTGTSKDQRDVGLRYVACPVCPSAICVKEVPSSGRQSSPDGFEI